MMAPPAAAENGTPASQNGAGAAVAVQSSQPEGVPASGGHLRVLLADRQEMYLEALVRAIEDDPDYELVATTSEGYTALELIRTEAPHVAVLDPSLPGLDGLAILKAVDRDALSTRVVMLSAEPEDRRPYQAIAAGASCYLTRGSRPEQIRAAIATAAGGSNIFDERLHPTLYAEVRRRTHEAEPPLDPALLEVIELTADGLDPIEVAERLRVSATTVKVTAAMRSSPPAATETPH